MIALDGAEERVEVRERVYDYRPATGMEARGRAEVDLAVEKIRRLVAVSPGSAEQLLERVAGMGLRWGVSDGS